MIKAVIFDFGQTLADSADGFRTAEKQAQDNLFANLGLTNREDFLTIYRRLRKEFHGRSDFSRNSLWREVFYYYCLAPETGRLEKWETEYWETVKARTTIFPETEEVLASLSARFEVALITNTQGQKTTGTHRISLFPELEKFFRVIIIAGENDIPPKPDATPFRLCLEKLDITAGQALYVGDDYRIDIRGARDSGLHPVWLKHSSVRRNWPAVQTSVPVITSLKQLLDLEYIF